MALVFYISGHGFGHASRSVEVINDLNTGRHGPIIIRTQVDPALLARSVRVPYDLRRGACDTGIVQASSIAHDDPATVRAALEFYEDFDARVDAERQLLESLDVDLVVGDIPPLAFAAASAIGVSSIAIGNFTWDWIYETHPGFLPAGAAVLEVIRQAYRQADLAIELPFAGGFDIFRRVERVPLVARHATRAAGETRAHFGLPADGRVALLSFGGYGLPELDLAQVDCRQTWTVVTTDRVTPTAPLPSHVRRIAEQAFTDSGFRYEDLVAAVDVVITKPGYGIMAECISTGTSMVYTPRGQFREYDVLVEAMPGRLRSAPISQADLFAGRWQAALNHVLEQPAPRHRMATNGAESAAATIESVLAARSSVRRR